MELGGQALGGAIYTAYGLEETYMDTYHYTLNELTYVAIDPVAQTFTATNDLMLSSVGVYFAQKDSSAPVFLQIREVSNGIPTSVVMGQVEVPSSEVNISGDGTVETKIAFKEPVYCEG